MWKAEETLKFLIEFLEKSKIYMWLVLVRIIKHSAHESFDPRTIFQKII